MSLNLLSFKIVSSSSYFGWKFSMPAFPTPGSNYSQVLLVFLSFPDFPVFRFLYSSHHRALVLTSLLITSSPQSICSLLPLAYHCHIDWSRASLQPIFFHPKSVQWLKEKFKLHYWASEPACYWPMVPGWLSRQNRAPDIWSHVAKHCLLHIPCFPSNRKY